MQVRGLTVNRSLPASRRLRATLPNRDICRGEVHETMEAYQLQLTRPEAEVLEEALDL